ncbi:hypothetical protein TNCV_2109301 [Trichonephila clavipes]|nr:hypothetical protein TNCV_2109301 [Trichonephila clavipes]
MVGPYSATVLVARFFLSPGASTSASRVHSMNPPSPSLTRWWLVVISHHNVPSHIGLNGDEIAGSLAKSATVDALRGDASPAFVELSSIKSMEMNALWRVPLLTLSIWGENLVGVTNLIFLGIGRRLYHAFLVATSGLLLLNSRVEKADQASPSQILIFLSFIFDEV